MPQLEVLDFYRLRRLGILDLEGVVAELLGGGRLFRLQQRPDQVEARPTGRRAVVGKGKSRLPRNPSLKPGGAERELGGPIVPEIEVNPGNLLVHRARVRREPDATGRTESFKWGLLDSNSEFRAPHTCFPMPAIREDSKLVKQDLAVAGVNLGV